MGETVVFQVCPMHALEEVDGLWVSDDVGWQFTCARTDHVEAGPYTWLTPPAPPAGTQLAGIAHELGLDVEIPSILAQFDRTWVEYGVFEHAYATANPKDWRFLMERYSHTAVAAKRYTVSAFLAATLGNLDRAGSVVFHSGPATGRWAYNGAISYWALPPSPDWSNRLTWEGSGLTVDYVPGQCEV